MGCNKLSLAKEAGKQLFRKQCTLKYPYEKSPLPTGFRGRPKWDMEKCIGCILCSGICPTKAIELVGKGNSAEIRYYLDRCIYCGECAEVCPKDAIIMSEEFEVAGFDRSKMHFSYKKEK